MYAEARDLEMNKGHPMKEKQYFHNDCKDRLLNVGYSHLFDKVHRLFDERWQLEEFQYQHDGVRRVAENLIIMFMFNQITN